MNLIWCVDRGGDHYLVSEKQPNHPALAWVIQGKQSGEWKVWVRTSDSEMKWTTHKEEDWTEEEAMRYAMALALILGVST